MKGTSFSIFLTNCDRVSGCIKTQQLSPHPTRIKIEGGEGKINSKWENPVQQSQLTLS
jgi:hypothetical protein